MLFNLTIALIAVAAYAGTARACFIAGLRIGQTKASQTIAETLLTTAARHRADYEAAHDLARLKFTKAEVAAYFRGIRKSAVVAFKMGEVDL